MRRIVAIALALLLCGAALAEGVPGNRLGYKVLAWLSGGERNAFVSPVSLAAALAMAAEGAQGETRDKLLKALEAEDTDQVAKLAGLLAESGVGAANAAFIAPGVELLPAYADRLDAWGAACFPLESAQGVADWVKEKTNGLIEDMPLELGRDDQLVLANAIAMEAEWASPFEPEDTWEEIFHAPDGDIWASFMHQKTYAQYGESNGIQFICKGYLTGHLALMIALPKEGGLKRALSALADNPKTFFTFKPNPTSVLLSLPKLDLSTSEHLKDAVSETGCRLPFQAEADFSGICGAPLMISDVLQQVRFQLDEAGTRAAAATEVVVSDGAAAAEESPAPLAFNVNRPFILAVVDRSTGAVLFAGAVVTPKPGVTRLEGTIRKGGD